MRSSSGSRGPLAHLPRRSYRALGWLAGLGALKAIAFLCLAQALADGIVGAIHGNLDRRHVIILAGSGVILRASATWATEVVSRRAAIGARESLREQLARRVLAHGADGLPHQTGALTALATRGLDGLDDYYSAYLPAFCASGTIPIIIGLRILLADWVSAAVILITMPLIPLFMWLIGHYTEERIEQAADAIARLSDHLAELALGLPVLVGLGQARRQTRALREIAQDVHRSAMTTLRVAFLSSLALELIATLSVAVVAVFIGLRLVYGQLDLQTGLLALILAPECFVPLRQVGAAYHASEDGVEALRRADEIITTPLPTSPLDPTSPSGLIRLDDVTVTYAGRPAPAVTSVSATILPGSTVVLEGESGSGKSTMLRVIGGLLGSSPLANVSGSIHGVDPAHIAWVPQHPESVSETVRDELALLSDNPAAIDQIATRTRLAHLLDRHPASMSPGELRRLAMARALLRIEAGATVLLLDEPTAHLDPDSAAIIRQSIEAVRGQVTIFLAAHDRETRALADHVIRLGTPGPQPTDPTPSAAPTPETRRADDATPPPDAPLSTRQAVRLVGSLAAIAPKDNAIALGFGLIAVWFAIALSALSGWLIVRASEQPPILYLLAAIVGVRFFGIGRAAARYAERVWLHDAIFAAMTGLRIRLWEWLAGRGIAIKRLLRSDESLDRLVGDVDRLRDLLPRVTMPAIVGAITAGLMIPVAGAFHAGAAVVMTLLAIATVLIAPGLALRADANAQRTTVALRSRTMRRFAAFTNAAPDIAANGMAGAVLTPFLAEDRRAADLGRTSAWALGLGEAVVVGACSAAAAATLLVGAGDLRGRTLALLVLIPLAMADSLNDLVSAIQQWPAFNAVAARVQPALASAPTPAAETDAEPISIREIAFDAVSARWPESGADVFSGLSFTADADHWTVVTGPSGSGKTTLLAVLMGFLRPTAGAVRIDGVDAAALPAPAIQRAIAWCPQESHIFNSTIRGNLMLAGHDGRAITDEAMHAALRRVGLGDLVATLPDGLETRVGPRGSYLSGGQRQRLAVARALLSEADVLLLDEPTAHLDRESADALLADLRAGLGGTIVIMVTHHLDDFAPTDRQVALR